jgi:hypothetical protein
MSVLENSKTSPDVSGHAQSGVALFWIRDVSTELKIRQCSNIRASLCVSK